MPGDRMMIGLGGNEERVWWVRVGGGEDEGRVVGASCLGSREGHVLLVQVI